MCNVSLVQLEFHFETFLVSSIVLLTHTTVVWLQGEGAEGSHPDSHQLVFCVVLRFSM